MVTKICTEKFQINYRLKYTECPKRRVTEIVLAALFTAYHQQRLEKGKPAPTSLRRRLVNPVYKNKDSKEKYN
jgi:hypothetical protein